MFSAMEPAYYKCTSAIHKYRGINYKAKGSGPYEGRSLRPDGMGVTGRRGSDAPDQQNNQHDDGNNDEYVHQVVHGFSLQDSIQNPAAPISTLMTSWRPGKRR
jgi:hypothetical protein